MPAGCAILTGDSLMQEFARELRTRLPLCPSSTPGSGCPQGEASYSAPAGCLLDSLARNQGESLPGPECAGPTPPKSEQRPKPDDSVPPHLRAPLPNAAAEDDPTLRGSVTRAPVRSHALPHCQRPRGGGSKGGVFPPKTQEAPDAAEPR